MLQFVTLLLVVFTPTYTPFGRSFAEKTTSLEVVFSTKFAFRQVKLLCSEVCFANVKADFISYCIAIFHLKTFLPPKKFCATILL